jgi:hypothetical protein
MRETWYILTDGRCVPPHSVATDDAGRLVYGDGVMVAMRDAETPHSRNVDPQEAGAEYVTRDLTAAPARRPYKRRGA